MKIEKIFRNIPDFSNIVLDTVLFESTYPVMFICRNNNDIYLFICCLVNASKIKWIGTKTTDENLIDLLENRISIRDAFLNVTDYKIMIKYNGQNTDYKIVKKHDIPEDFLPTSGEYMDAEDDEYTEELLLFKKRSLNIKYAIKPRVNCLWMLSFNCIKVTLTDDYFNTDVETKDVMQYKMEKINRQDIVLA